MKTATAKTAYKKAMKSPLVKKGLHTVTTKLKQELASKINSANPTIGGLAAIAIEASKKFKTPAGVDGRNLNIVDAELVETTAAKSTTDSASLYFYRPHRKSHPAESLDYTYKRNRSFQETIGANVQGVGDVNGMVLEPPLNDPNDNTSYSNISVRKIFTDALQARYRESDGTAVHQPEQNLSVHLGTYTQTLQIVAPAQGAIVDIYDLRPKFGIGPSTYIDETSLTGFMSPRYCMSTGLTEVIEPDDTYTLAVLGARPVDSLMFKRTWEVIKKTTVRMTDSSIHRHRSVFGINKTISYQEMAQASTSGGMAPWCPTQMVIVRGFASTTEQAKGVTVAFQQETSLNYRAYPGGKTKVIVYDDRT